MVDAGRRHWSRLLSARGGSPGSGSSDVLPAVGPFPRSCNDDATRGSRITLLAEGQAGATSGQVLLLAGGGCLRLRGGQA